jgi:hypothetical protein
MLAREAAGLAPDCDAVWVGVASISSDPDERLDALRRANDLRSACHENARAAARRAAAVR